MTNSQKDLWRAALGEIEVALSQASFTTWFKNTSLESVSDGVATVRVPNGFTKEWLQNKYDKIILRALRNRSPDIREVCYTISRTPTEDESEPEQSVDTETIAVKESLSFDDNIDSTTNLNPRYTFDSFVVASSNELAYAAAQSVGDKPGEAYNPLFIYGGVGLGKTHLLQAIGNHVLQKGSDQTVLYVSSETFTNELITSLGDRRMDEFKDKYRKIDVLIIDDVQFLAGREKTQTEFFHTFNHLYERNKQIILSSDRPPKAIPTLEERLRSRFEGGMIADISPPDFETRFVILRKKLEERDPDVEVNEKIIEHIASSIQRNVRELEGALNRIIGHAEVKERPLTFDEAQSILKTIIATPRSRTSPDTIINTVASFYNVTKEDLCNRSRKKEVVKPRQIAMYLLRTELDSSFPSIGEHLGNRDHTTAMYACQKVEDLKNDDETFAQELSALQDQLYTEDV